MKNIEAKVGAFVVISVVILGVSVFYVSKATLGGKQVPYRIYLRYAGGLQSGTGVLFGGMTVGKVTAVQPDREDPTRIAIDFDVKEGTPVNAKSVAKLGSISLMSSPVLSISTGSKDAPRLQAGSVLTSQETISMDEMERKIAALADSAQNTLASVQTNVNNISADARHLLGNLNNVTGKANQEHVSRILTNADDMVTQLSPKVGPSVDNINETVSSAHATITAIRQPVQVDLEELRRTLVGTQGFVGDLQSLVQTNNQNITYTLENIRMTTDNLNDLTESVKEQPWSLIRIRQPKDRSVPK